MYITVFRKAKPSYVYAILKKTSPPQSWSKAVVCASTPRKYPRSGYFLVRNNQKRHVSLVDKGKRNISGKCEKPFKCQRCDFSFKMKSSLKVHIAMVHEGKRPFECSSCGSRFGYKNDFNEEIVPIHENKKHFKCYICDVSCKLKFNYLLL